MKQTPKTLLAKCYCDRQEDDEAATKWYCRLEDILYSGVDRHLIDPKNVHDMLRNMF